MLGLKSHRCTDCRNCDRCKRSENTEVVSIQEEIEQDIIDKSVQVDVSKGITIAKLPFIVNPELRLLSNKRKALAVCMGQIRKLNKVPDDRNDVMKSESKLQSRGYVDLLDNLNGAQFGIATLLVLHVNSCLTHPRQLIVGIA